MKNWRLWIGILISLLCIYFMVKGMDFRSLLAALTKVQYTLLLPACGILVFGFLARAFRWRVLFYTQSDLRIGRLFNLVNIGYLLNHVSPLRLGDVLRACLCAELEKLNIMYALSTVVVERIADTLTIVFLLLFLIPSLSLPVAFIRPAFGVGLLAITVGIFLIFLALQRERNLRLFDRLATRLGFLKRRRVRQGVVSAIDGLASLGSPRGIVGVLAWSLAIWASTTVEFYVVMRAVGLHQPFAAALAVLCFTSLGMVVPSSPGYLGVFEYITVLSLSLFGVSREMALSYALVLHALSYLVVAVLGLTAVWIEGYSYTHLRQVLNQAESEHRLT